MRAYKRHSNRGFTLVELMIVVAIIGILAALAIYGVSRFLASSKTAEAKQTVGAISRGAQAAYERQLAPSQNLAPGASSDPAAQNLCASADYVPDAIDKVKGKKYQPQVVDNKDFETGDDITGWKCLRFRMSDPIQYRYSYRSGEAPLSGQVTGAGTFEAGAEGDVDADNVTSKFALTGKVVDGLLTRSTQVYILNESE